MSPDSEDLALEEEALRGDLPSPETNARLRRRLLAAGLAIGNGAAASTAAAAGAAGAGAAPGVVAGMVSKGLALSWGVKLGVLAVVAIPSVGLLVESQTEPRLAPPPPALVVPAAPVRSPERATLPSPPLVAAEPAMASEPAPVAAPSARPRSAELVGARVQEAAPTAPSQVDFATTDAAVAAKAASTLAEETRLLDSAFAELAAGRTARANELVAEHQRRFPNGLLQKERERARTRLTEMSRGE